MTETITIDQDLCLNGRFKEMHCQRCRDQCPANCIDETGQIQANLCNHCGVCVAVCPVEAIAALAYSNRELEHRAAENPSLFACKKQNRESSWPCLGFLESKLLFALAYKGSMLIVDDRACRQCNPAVHIQLTNAVANANRMLTFCNKSVIQSGDKAVQIKVRGKAISRRGFFSEIFGAALETIREVTFPTGATIERLERQKWIATCLSAMPAIRLPENSKVFFNITISDACQACGLCAKLCSSKAITVIDLTSELEIYHQPVQCTGCHVCVTHCPVQAIAIGAANQLGKHRVIQAKLPRCSSCDQLFQPVDNQRICLECMLKNRLQTGCC